MAYYSEDAKEKSKLFFSSAGQTGHLLGRWAGDYRQYSEYTILIFTIFFPSSHWAIALQFERKNVQIKEKTRETKRA